MGKVVNVILNSHNAINTASPSSSNNNNLNYFIDWSAILKDGKAYKLHWCYTSQINLFAGTTKLAQVRVDFQMENYLSRSSTYGAPTTTAIGILEHRSVISASNWYLYADDNTNPVVYFNTRPYNNNFTVQVVTNDPTPVLWTDQTGSSNNHYILTLSFEEEDD